jgi:hypothetical protein
MRLHEYINKIKNKEDLADFIVLLNEDLMKNPDEWENDTLSRFLLAMEDWIRSMDNYYIHTAQQVPSEPTWKVFADILYASKIYE